MKSKVLRSHQYGVPKTSGRENRKELLAWSQTQRDLGIKPTLLLHSFVMLHIIIILDFWGFFLTYLMWIIIIISGFRLRAGHILSYKPSSILFNKCSFLSLYFPKYPSFVAFTTYQIVTPMGRNESTPWTGSYQIALFLFPDWLYSSITWDTENFLNVRIKLKFDPSDCFQPWDRILNIFTFVPTKMQRIKMGSSVISGKLCFILAAEIMNCYYASYLNCL